MEQDEKFLTTGEAARILELSPDSVRSYERDGKLSAIRVGKGQRLFSFAQVEQLRAEREKRAACDAR